MYGNITQYISGLIFNISESDISELALNIVIIVFDSLQKLELLWKTKQLEAKIFVLFCLTLTFEAVVLILVWNRYSSKLHAVKKSLLGQHSFTTTTTEREEVEESLSRTILMSEHTKAAMSAIKRFFERKKLDKKFRKAGEGHTLNSAKEQGERQQSAAPPKQSTEATAISRPNEAQRQAADAALTRLSAQSAATPSIRTGREAIKAQVKRELEQERKMASEARHYTQEPEQVVLDSAHVSACGGVFFTCPLIPNVMLPKKEMEGEIERFLSCQLSEDAEMASALLIHTVNKDVGKVKVCIETLCKYIDNLIMHPGEDKYRKIKCSNKAFRERVGEITGGVQFLLCAGYQLQRQVTQEGHEEDFYVISTVDAADSDKLKNLKEVLTNAEPIRAVLWRAPRLFHCPGNSNPKFGDLPDEFYAISKEEIKREQQAKEQAVEKMGMLRTKAMRERDELRELRKYRYTLLRVRFPQNIYLQAIFKSNESLKDLHEFIKEQLEFDWLPFWLLDRGSERLREEERTLAELHLVPACILTFCCDKEILSDAQRGGAGPRHVLQQSLLDKLENWAI